MSSSETRSGHLRPEAARRRRRAAGLVLAMLPLLVCVSPMVHARESREHTGSEFGPGTAGLQRGVSAVPAALHGTWRVAGSAAMKPSRVSVETASAVPAVVVDGDGVRWQNPPDQDGADYDGRCDRPVYDGSLDARSLAQWRKTHTRALRTLQIDPASVIEAMQFLCTGPTSDWGPDGSDQASLIRLKDGGLLMPWFDNQLLRLQANNR